MAARFDAPVGRYVHLELDGVDHRVYFEEAGEGIPVLLQHTAGAHGAQWRHLMEDERITSRFRLIAYDLPFHGKSLPPVGPKWWAEEYRLTRERLMSVPVALAEALELERPVYMGCSIGGLLALDLARYHPERFRAVVGLEAALKVGGSLEPLAGFWHPRVSNEYKATAMYGLMAPTSPEAYRRETVFVYSQGWPPAFLGDLYYYIVDHDLADEAGAIDTSKCPVYLLTGEYDYSATIEHGQAAHEAVAGSTFEVMRDMGHFPMAENPDRFIEYLLPVLERIGGDAVDSSQALANPESFGRFDTRALHEALNEQRLARGMTWQQVAKETGVAASTLSGTSRGGRLEADGVIRMSGWLGRPVESFVRKP